MLQHIISFSIRNKLIIALGVLGLIIYGSYQLSRLPIDAVPDITNKQVQIITVAPSFAAVDIERLVTFPVEQACSNLAGLEEIRSFSRFGLSVVTVVFDDETDLMLSRQQIAERIASVSRDLPEGMGSPELGPVTTGLGEIFQYTVSAAPGYEERYSLQDLRSIQDWVIRRQLLGVKGVAEVSSFGGKLKQIEIQAEPAKLQALGLSIADLYDAISKNNFNAGGSYIEKGPLALFIRTDGLLKTKDDILNTLVSTQPDGKPILIRDLASVSDGYANRYGAMTLNDKGEVAGAIVMMLKDANSSEVITAVKQRMEEIRKTLPKGILVEPFLDRTKMVNSAIGTVEKNLMEGALIVIFILVIFLGQLRAGLLVASVIPLSMLFAVIMMNSFGVSGNLMSLGALDFGLIVDGAVIVVEAVLHLFALKQSASRNKDELTREAAGGMMQSAVFGQFIILAVYLPIFSLQGIEGKMFRPMAQTVSFALIGSFILSLTYIPMMSALILKKSETHHEGFADRMMRRLQHFYLPLLGKSLRQSKKILLSVVLMFLISLYLLSTLGGEFVPELEEGDFAVEARVLTGSNLQTTMKFTSQAAGLLKQKFPEVERVVTKIGSGEVPTDPMPMEASDMMVILKPPSEWSSAESFPELAEKMQKALHEVPALSTGFQYPVQMRFNELMTGARQDVVCKIFGEDLDTLVHYASQLGELVKGIEGAADVYVEPVEGMPQLIIRPRREAMGRYGVTMESINRQISACYAGLKAGDWYENERQFDIVIRMPAAARMNIEDIRRLNIQNIHGHPVPLSLVAEVSEEPGPNQIQRENARRRIVVGFNIAGRDVASIVQELKQKAGKGLKLPPAYSLQFGGSFENLEKAKTRLMIAVPVALFLILMLLYFAFGDLMLGLLIFSAIPLSAIGGILALILRGLPFSISAGIGFIALFGVAVLNGLVLVSEFKKMEAAGIRLISRILLDGAGKRLRPVLMTAAVASLGFLPMALSHGAGSEVQRPLATVVIGGLVSATFLTLIVLPILYAWFYRRKQKKINHRPLVLLLILFGSLHHESHAQDHPLMKPFLDAALQQHPELQIQKLRNEQATLQKKTARDIPVTQISTELGQINSIYYDNRFSVQQQIEFPTVYIRSALALEKEYESVMHQSDYRRALVQYEIRNMVYRIRLLRQQEQFLQEGAKLWDAQTEKASLREQRGETGMMEKMLIGNQLFELHYEQEKNRNERYETEQKLMLLTGMRELPDLSELPLIANIPSVMDSLIEAQHPLLLSLEKQMEQSEWLEKKEQAKRLPILGFSVSDMSMQGVGADDIRYGAGQRFRSAQLSLGIPLFNTAQKQRASIAKKETEQWRLAREHERRKMAQRLGVLVRRCRELSSLYNQQYEALLTQTALMIKLGQQQYEAGIINMSDYLLLSRQSLNTRLQLLDMLSNLNQVIFEYQLLKNKS